MSDKPMRVQRLRTKGAKPPPNTVSVTRPGRWGNPFDWRFLGAALAVEMFEDEMQGFFDPGKLAHLSDNEFRAVHNAKEAWAKKLNWGLERAAGARCELRGKNLACFCKLCPEHKTGKPFNVACPDCAPCHSDPLGAIANNLKCESVEPLT